MNSKNAHVLNSSKRRLMIQTAASVAGISSLGFPALSLAQNKPIRVGMPTILSGRVAMLGQSSSNAAIMEVEKFNASGGFGGRKIELIIRDSKGQPQEAARVARELVTADGCEILIDAEASSGAFAVHEVARDLGVLVIHTCSETSSLTADPKMRTPMSFRCARQGVHDAIIGGAYAAKVAKEKNLHRWMTCSPDYAYGRDTTAEFAEYIKFFNKDIEFVGEAWPKLFQADYSEVITRLLQVNPQVPAGLHSGNRYLQSFPNTPANTSWTTSYQGKFKSLPLNWAWQNAASVQFLTTAIKKAKSTDAKKIAQALDGLTIDSPFGANGKLTLRADDHTLVDYALAWGELSGKEPFMKSPVPGNWKQITELEAEWKKRKGFV